MHRHRYMMVHVFYSFGKLVDYVEKQEAKQYDGMVRNGTYEEVWEEEFVYEFGFEFGLKRLLG